MERREDNAKEVCFVPTRLVVLSSESPGHSYFKVMVSDHCTVEKEAFHLFYASPSSAKGFV